jgi:pimeloyl-ACP methyl ester carboxylesterase
LLADRIPAAVTISAPAPFPAAGLDFFAGMSDGSARELRAAAQGRAELEQVLATNDFDPASFIAADYAALDGSWSWFNRIVQAATVNGPDGMIEDDLGAMAPWGFDPAQVTVPTLIMHGTADRMVPSSHAEWLAARCPNAELRLVPGEGHVSVLNSALDALVWLRDRLSGTKASLI